MERFFYGTLVALFLSLFLAAQTVAQFQVIKNKDWGTVGNSSWEGTESWFGDACYKGEETKTGSNSTHYVAHENQLLYQTNNYETHTASGMLTKNEFFSMPCSSCKSASAFTGGILSYANTRFNNVNWGPGGKRISYTPEVLPSGCGYKTVRNEETIQPGDISFGDRLGMGPGGDACSFNFGNNCIRTGDNYNYTYNCYESSTSSESKPFGKKGGYQTSHSQNIHVGGSSHRTQCGEGGYADTAFAQCFETYSGRTYDPDPNGPYDYAISWTDRGTAMVSDLQAGTCNDGDNCTFDQCDFLKGGCKFTPIPGCNQQHTECQNNSCAVVNGKGNDQCRGNQDCQGSYSICQNNSCTTVFGNGISTCSSNADCQQSHTVCMYESCIQVQGPGTNECGSNQDCIQTHTVCEAKTCKVVQGQGKNECNTNQDCEKEKHLECVDKACKQVEGPGADGCSTNQDCEEKHTVCQDKSCATIPGSGENQCGSDKDCEKEKHLTCQNGSCAQVNGPGSDQCQTAWDCKKETHAECRNYSCVSVQGPGRDACQNSWDCQPNHLECKNNACISVFGMGSNQCQTNKDCEKPEHLACVGQSCQKVSGPGKDSCSTNNDCVPDSHLECQGNACEKVQGKGTDQCKSSADCFSQQKHTQCDYTKGQCIVVAGFGTNECVTNDQCAWHTECDYGKQKCVMVPGVGKNQCSFDAECQVQKTRLVCNFEKQTCERVWQVGKNECATFGDCNTDGYLKCNYTERTCDWAKKVTGKETNECLSFLDCLQPPERSCAVSINPGKINSGGSTNVTVTLNNFGSIQTIDNFRCGDNAILEPPGLIKQPGENPQLFTGTCSKYGGGIWEVGQGLVVDGIACSTAQLEVSRGQPSCSMQLTPSEIVLGKDPDKTMVTISLQDFANPPEIVSSSCDNGKGILFDQPPCKGAQCTGNCSGYTKPNAYVVSAALRDGPGGMEVGCEAQLVVVGGKGTKTTLGLYIDQITIDPSTAIRGVGVNKIVVAVFNRSKADCDDGRVSLEFLDEDGKPLQGFNILNKSNQKFPLGGTPVEFSRSDGLDTSSLPIGVYSVKGQLYCPNTALQDQKKVFYSIAERKYSQIPETSEWVLALLLGAVVWAAFFKTK